MFTRTKTYYPYISPFNPCNPITAKTFSTPPNLYIGFQPPNLEQFTPMEALRTGTLWKVFYDPYFSPYEKAKGGPGT